MEKALGRGKDTPPIIKDGKIKQLQNALFVKDERRRFIRRIKEEDTDKGWLANGNLQFSINNDETFLASPVIFLLFYIKKKKEKNPPA